MRFSIIILLLFSFLEHLGAQEGIQSNNLIANIIEDFLESTDAENFDYNTIFENLNFYYENQLNINSANELELRDLFLLNEIQISNFITYRTQFGNFLSIYELQAIPSWDLITIRNVSLFWSVKYRQQILILILKMPYVMVHLLCF